jgi:hypothetical protein
MRENASNSALALGSAATPSLKFTGDTNTGIYSPGADQLALATGGTGRLFVDTAATTSTLPVVHPLGAVGTPSITFTGDLNTGIYSPAADTIAFVEGGAEAMRLDSSGRLGLGTSAVTGFVTAYRAGAADQFIHIENGTTANGVDYNVAKTLKVNLVHGGKNAGFDSGWELNSGCGSGIATNNGYLTISKMTGAVSATTEVARFDSQGRLGLGTSAPQYNLHGTGYVGLGTQASPGAGAGIHFIPSSTLTNWFAGSNYINSGTFQIIPSTAGGGSTFTTPAVTIDSSSRVGIGTTAPGATLQCDGDTRLGVVNNGTRVFAIHNTSSNASYYTLTYNDTTGLVTQANSYGFVFNSKSGGGAASNATESLRIDSSGRLLVGTSSTAVNTRLLLQGSSGSNNANMYLCRANAPASDDPLGYIIFSDNSQNDTAYIFASRDGGTWTAGSSQPTRLVFSTTADGASSPTERMRIRANGTTSVLGGFGIGSAADPGSTFAIASTVITSGAGNSTLKYNTTTGIVTYDTSSRFVKESIVDCPYGVEAVKLLQPRKYFRTDDQRDEIGFIADELVGVLPEFVPIGPKSVITKNEDDTEEIPLGVNYEKLTAVLTKALQEAIAKIEVLEQRLTDAGIA